ncbi:MAG: endolytic transglycosylase MltG [Spirochaetota bacterium]
MHKIDIKFIIFLFFFSTIILFILYSYGFIVTHIIPINSNFVLSVNSGDNLNSILKILKEKGLKGNLFIIKLYTKLFYKNLLIKIGSYQVNEYSTYWSIIQDIDKGIGIPFKLTIPPGLKISEIANLLADKNIMTEKEFFKILSQQDFMLSAFSQNLNLINDPQILSYWQKFKIELGEKKFEGFFYPETYSFAKGTSSIIILQNPIQYFFKILEKFPISNLTPLEIYKKIIVASLIEEEAMVDSEKPIIASVIYNRLNKKMRLELCPTVEYILPSHKKKLTLDDLNIKSPYNTYINSGLPPTPICNPSFESLKAAFFPAKTDYLFYVAKGDGTHYFSKTYSEHLKYKNYSNFY